MKAIDQYFYVVLFIMLYKVVLTFKSVPKTLVSDLSDERYLAILSCGLVNYAKRRLFCLWTTFNSSLNLKLLT